MLFLFSNCFSIIFKIGVELLPIKYNEINVNNIDFWTFPMFFFSISVTFIYLLLHILLRLCPAIFFVLIAAFKRLVEKKKEKSIKKIYNYCVFISACNISFKKTTMEGKYRYT